MFNMNFDSVNSTHKYLLESTTPHPVNVAFVPRLLVSNCPHKQAGWMYRLKATSFSSSIKAISKYFFGEVYFGWTMILVIFTSVGWKPLSNCKITDVMLTNPLTGQGGLKQQLVKVIGNSMGLDYAYVPILQ